MRSVLQDWVMELPLMQQATLITATRGPDGFPKEGVHKHVCRYIRYLALVPAHTDHLSNPTDTFMSVPLDQVEEFMTAFVKDHDQYPVHWVMHIVHAYEVLGYQHPETDVKAKCRRFYVRMCHAFHLYAESALEMQERLKD